MAIEVQAPNSLPEIKGMKRTVFLAGSIDMDNAERWQEKVIAHFKDYENLVFLNPRRDDFDSSQEQRADNKYFREQVEWELMNLSRADFVVMYLAPGSQSPISLLELGRLSEVGSRRNSEVIVCCPDDFYRKGNVEIVCEWGFMDLVHTYDGMITKLEELFKSYESNIVIS